MRAREERHNVIIPARLRWEGRWVAASIRNISAHGMMLRTPTPPGPGTYVEVQLGGGVITARAMWTSGQSCGLRSRDKLDIASLSGTRGARVAPNEPAAASRVARIKSPDERAVASRQFASRMQFVTFAFVGIAAASSLSWEIYQTLSAPISTIQQKLA